MLKQLQEFLSDGHLPIVLILAETIQLHIKNHMTVHLLISRRWFLPFLKDIKSNSDCLHLFYNSIRPVLTSNLGINFKTSFCSLGDLNSKAVSYFRHLLLTILTILCFFQRTLWTNQAKAGASQIPFATAYYATLMGKDSLSSFNLSHDVDVSFHSMAKDQPAVVLQG